MNIWLAISIFELFVILLLIWSLYSLAMRSLDTEDKIEDAMNILEEKYKRMSSILDRPVFFDSVEVRQVVSDIYDCQIALYEIMSDVGDIEEEENEE